MAKAPAKPKKKELTKRQQETMKKHAKHHSKKHMAAMKKDMLAGMSFTKAHVKAKKMVGN
jgi:hypothetical protein|tara:strand:+ start:28 stop:207 length:180 start_codon:yes stop_codon:yes gene_type:complete